MEEITERPEKLIDRDRPSHGRTCDTFPALEGRRCEAAPSLERRFNPIFFYTTPMLISLFLMAIFLAAGNVVFWHFDPEQPLWRRLLKVFLSLTITALAWR